MKFFSDLRLLMLAIWLGAAVFFIGVAQVSFGVIADREQAGAVVGRSLSVLSYSGLAIAIILLLTSLVASSRISAVWLWIERFLLLIVAAACAVQEFVIGIWMSSIRSQLSAPIDQIAADDSLKIRFEQLHQYSVWTLMAAMIAGVLAFFIISNRTFHKVKAVDDVYDFSKEFKV
jgi:hypothetical protein